MPKIHDVGFSPVGDHLHQGPYRFNVIFVHGLKGHPERTWGHRQHDTSGAGDVSSHEHRKSARSFLRLDKLSPRAAKSRGNPDPAKPFWPEAFLAQDLPEARIWTYGYNSHVIEDTFKPNNKNNISQHGRDLAVKFDQSIDNEDPVVFIAHSLGGILVKDALQRSDACRKRTKLVVFLGTPHRGSAQAAWGVIATNIARLALVDSNKSLVAGLQVNNEVLENIQEQFVNLLHETNIKVHSFQEGRGVSGVSGFNGKIVSDESSKLGLSKAVETVQTIDADHRQMTKFLTKDAAGYRDIVAVLRGFEQSMNVRNLAVRPANPRVESNRDSSISQMSSHVSPNGPPFFHIPLPANERFVGRQSILQQLNATLFGGTEHRKVAIVGLGGIGKTQVALHLALDVKSKKPGYSVFWVSAVSVATFEQSYASIMKVCGLNSDGIKDPKVHVKAFLESAAAGDWLLIVDNIDEEEVLWSSSGEGHRLVDFLPESDQGRIVFTTRFRKLGLAAASPSIIDLSDISPQEARIYFENSLVDKGLMDDDKAVTELLQLLTGLPLAITQAAAYLNENQISVAEYLELFKNTEQDKIELLKSEFNDDTRYRQAQNAIANTLVLSFSQLRKVDVFAERLLLFISCIEPKAIPLSLLPETESRQQLIHAVGTLCGYGFLTRRQNRTLFDMHSLVHAASRAWLLEIGTVEDENRRAISWIQGVFPDPDWDTRELWRQYLPHALKVLDLTMHNTTACNLGYTVAVALNEEGRIRESSSLLEKVVQVESRILQEDNLNHLTSQYELACTYGELGETQKALHLLKSVLAIQLRTLSEDNPHSLTTQHQLAILYREEGQIQESLQLMEHIVAIESKTLSEDNPLRLTSQFSLAKIYKACGQLQKAIKIAEHVVAVASRDMSEEHPDHLAYQYDLALMYKEDNQLQKALQILEHVVEVESKVLSEEHPDRLLSQHALAETYAANGQKQRAITILERVVSIESKVLPEDNPDRLTSQHTLATTYEKSGQLQRAIAMLEHVVSIESKVLLEDNPSRLTSQYTLAKLYKADGRSQRAMAMLEYVVSIESKALPEDNPNRLTSQYALAVTYEESGHLQKAFDLLEHVALIESQALDKDDERRLMTLEVLERVSTALAQAQEAA